MTIYFNWISFVLLLLGGCAKTSGPGSGALKPTPVIKTDIVQKITSAGKVSSKQTSLISAPYDGHLKKVFVKVGQQVKEGDPLVSLVESTALTGVPSWPMRAPFSGTITHIFYKEGEFVDAKDGEKKNILRIDNLDGFYVQADIAEMDVVNIQKGQKVIIKFSALLDKNYEGIVETISLAPRKADNWRDTQVLFPAQIKVLRPDAHLRPGLSVILDIILQKKDQVLALPHHYIGKENEKHFVTTIKGEKKLIQVGLHDDDFYEITQGLELGEEVLPVAL